MSLKWRWLSVGFIGGWLSYRWWCQLAVPPQPLAQWRSDVDYSKTPTLFVPGWGGHAWTYNRLLHWLAMQGYGHKVLTVRVDWHGHLHFSGQWQPTETNPLIQVLFDHSLTRSYQPQIDWITAILRALKQQYGVTAYNVVAHSWGGSAAIHSVVSEQRSGTLPRLHRMILLGAPVDEGRPGGAVDLAYQRLHAARHRLRSLDATVINVYGTLAGRQTDGSVPVYQVTALRDILRGGLVTYHEVHLARTSHGQLHASPKVWRFVGESLWGQTKKPLTRD